MLERLTKTRNDLIVASEHVDAKFDANSSVQFDDKVRLYFITLKEINTVTKESQEKDKSLAVCSFALNILISAVTEEKTFASHAYIDVSLVINT